MYVFYAIHTNPLTAFLERTSANPDARFGVTNNVQRFSSHHHHTRQPTTTHQPPTTRFCRGRRPHPQRPRWQRWWCPTNRATTKPLTWHANGPSGRATSDQQRRKQAREEKEQQEAGGTKAPRRKVRRVHDRWQSRHRSCALSSPSRTH
jgi:hypothetical protein